VTPTSRRADVHPLHAQPGVAFLAAALGRSAEQSEARVLLCAIAGQETGWQNIPQGGGGPGRGPWQFESETCEELIFNPASHAWMIDICRALGLPTSQAPSTET